MPDLQFGIRISADGSAYVNGIQVVKQATEQLATDVKSVGQSIDRSLNQGAAAFRALADSAGSSQHNIQALDGVARTSGQALERSFRAGADSAAALAKQADATRQSLANISTSNVGAGIAAGVQAATGKLSELDATARSAGGALDASLKHGAESAALLARQAEATKKALAGIGTGNIAAGLATGAQAARISLDNLGKSAKQVEAAFKSGLASGINEGIRAFERQVDASNKFIQSLKDETAQLGLNTLQKRQYAIQQAALHAPTDALRQKILAEGQAFTTASQSAASHGSILQSVGRSMLGLVGIAAGIQLARTWAESSDAITLLNARLGLVTNSTQELTQAQGLLRSMAQRLQLPYAELGGTFARIGTAVKELGGGLATTAKLTEALAAGARLSGASTTQATSSMIQFAQALGRGSLNGDELRSVLENNLRFAQALAAGLGKTVGDLKQLGEEGKLTADKVINAVLSQLPTLQAELGKIPTTIGGAFTALFNELQRATAGSSAAKVLAGTIKDAADELERFNRLAEATPARLKDLEREQERSISFWRALKDGINAALYGFEQAKKINLANINDRLAVGKIRTPAEAPEEILGSANALSRLQDELKKADTVPGITARAKEKIDALKNDFELAAKDPKFREAAAKLSSEYSNAIASIERKRQEDIAKLNKKIAGPQLALPDMEGAIKAQLALAKAQTEAQFAVQDDADKRSLAQLKSSYDLRLITQEDYFDRSDAIQTRRANENLIRITQEVEGEEAAIRKLEQLRANVKPGKAHDAEQFKISNEIVLQEAKLLDLKAKQKIAYEAVGDVAVAAGDRIIAANKENEKALLGLINQYDSFAKALKDEADQREFEISLIGKTEKAQAVLTAVRRIDLKVKEELAKLDKEAAAFGDSATRVQIQGYIDLRAEVIATGEAQKGIAATQISTSDDLRKGLEGQIDLWKSIESTAHDAFTNILQSGKNAFDRLRDALKQGVYELLYQLTVKKFIVNLAVTASGTASGGAVAQALGGSVNYGSLLSSGASLLGTGASTGIAGAVASGVTSAFGASGFTAALAGDAFLPAALGVGGAATGTGVGLMAGAGAALAAIPVAGWIALAALAAYAIFSGSKEPSKVKGRLGITESPLGFEDNAYTASRRFGNIGFLDADTQQFSGEAAQVFNKIISGALDAVADRLSEDQIARLKTKLQGTTFEAFEGTYTTEDFLQKYGASALKTIFTAAFSELNASMGVLVANFSGTAEALSNFGNALLGLHDALNVDPAKLAAAALEQATRTSSQSLALLRQAVFTAATAFDGSQASIVASATALNQYNAALAQQLVFIQQTRDALTAMFATTREQIEFAGLDKQAAYDLAQQKGTDILATALTSNDPEKIKEYGEKINSYFLQAFNLLAPEEQLLHKQEFLDRLLGDQERLDARLNFLAASGIEEAKAPVEATRAALDAAAAKFDASADKNTANTDRQATIADREEALTTRDEAVASRNEATAARLEAIVIPVQIYDARSPAVGI